MNELDIIKEKIKEFFDKFENKESMTISETITLFKEIFKDNYFEKNTYEDSPYYKLDTESIYIKEGYGIGISKVSGPGDFTGGGLVSHKGVDLFVFSELADYSIVLFDESERNKNIKNYEKLFDLDLSLDNLMEVRDDYIFKCLPEKIKKNEQLILERYKKLKRSAEVKHDMDVEDDLISYYGGLDVTINPTEYYLYNSLLTHKEDTFFMKRAMMLFIQDFPDYIDDEIDRCEHALYMIINKDEYYKIANLDKDIFLYLNEFSNINKERDEYSAERSKLQIKLKDSLEMLKKLNKNKYNIMDLLTGKKKENDIRIVNLENSIVNIKNRILEIDDEMDKLSQMYKEFEKEEEQSKKDKIKISSNLEREFEDFTLDPDFEAGPYVDGEYYLITSLDRLINKKDEYIEKLNELKQMKSFIPKTIENKNEKTKEIDKVEYDY